MRPTKVLSGLREVLGGKPNLTVIVGSGESRQDGSEDLGFYRLRVTQKVAAEFHRGAEAVLPAGEDSVVLQPYDPGYKPDPHELCYLRLRDYPEVEQTVRAVSDVDSAELFHEEPEILEGLRFYALVLQSAGEEPAVFFRSYRPTKELTRSASFGIVLRGGFYDKIEKPVFVVDDKVDCYSWQGFMFVRNVAQFHRIFRYFQGLVDRAEQTFEVVSPRIPISNFEEFKSACLGNVLMLSKLAQIAKKPYLQSVTMADIKRTLAEFGLEVPIVVEAGVEKLTFEASPAKRWTILKLLDDDYLGSVMTQLKYVANSKTAVG